MDQLFIIFFAAMFLFLLFVMLSGTVTGIGDMFRKKDNMPSSSELKEAMHNLRLRCAEEKIKILRKALNGEEVPYYPDMDLTPNDRILVQQCTSDTSLQNEIMRRLDTIEKNTLYSSDSPHNIWKDRK
jgi:hypothetical protein